MLITYFRTLLAQLSRGEEGQTAVEYGLVLALVALVVAGVLATGASEVIGEIVTAIKAKV